jgi:hypothetical protein
MQNEFFLSIQCACYNPLMSKKPNEPRSWRVTIVSLLCALGLSFFTYLMFEQGLPEASNYYGIALLLTLVVLIISLLRFAISGKRSKLYKIYEIFSIYTPWP